MADTARNRILEEERRRLESLQAGGITGPTPYVPIEWGGPANREYVQRRQGLDITGNRDRSIEGAPNMSDAVANQSNNIIQKLLGISTAQAATDNSQNNVNLPGTMFSRGVDSLLEWSKGDWNKPWPHEKWYDWATDGQGMSLPSGQTSSGAGRPTNVRPTGGPSNIVDQINDSVLVEKSIKAGDRAALKIQERRAEEELVGAEGADFLLGGAIWDFLQRPGIQNALEVMQQPEFIRGNFTSGALGPYAEAKAAMGSRETEGLEAYAKYMAAQPGPVDLTGEIGERADRSLYGVRALDMIKEIRNVMHGGNAENITGFKSGLDKLGGKILSFTHTSSDDQPQEIVKSLRATLLQQYVAAMGIEGIADKKHSAKRYIDKIITVEGLFRRDEDVYKMLDVMEETLQRQTTLNTRLIGSQGYNINQLTQPIDFGTYNPNN